MKMVYDEWYGELSYAQRAAYKKHNVSPSDHDSLMAAYREAHGFSLDATDKHTWATRMVKRNSENGMFSIFDFWRNEGAVLGHAGESPFGQR
jgi:hypothetical protein